jgi:hypothetical protein
MGGCKIHRVFLIILIDFFFSNKIDLLGHGLPSPLSTDDSYSYKHGRAILYEYYAAKQATKFIVSNNKTEG